MTVAGPAALEPRRSRYSSCPSTTADGSTGVPDASTSAVAGSTDAVTVGWFVLTTNGPTRVPAVPGVAGAVIDAVTARSSGVVPLLAFAPSTRYQ